MEADKLFTACSTLHLITSLSSSKDRILCTLLKHPNILFHNERKTGCILLCVTKILSIFYFHRENEFFKQKSQKFFPTKNSIIYDSQSTFSLHNLFLYKAQRFQNSVDENIYLEMLSNLKHIHELPSLSSILLS